MQDRSHRNYLVVVLLVIHAFNYVDRNALGLLMQDIKVDLQLSDTQLGLLTGIAFAFFYSLLGIPLARWADFGNRVMIISLTTALWSAAVALCGLASSFTMLLMVRVGVAVGEAGCVPPALSLISDHFSRAERPRAVSLYMLGVPIGLWVGFFASGWLNEFYGWRATFVLLGFPGLILAAIAWYSLKEPRRQSATQNVGESPDERQPTLSETLRVLWADRTFRHILIGFSIATYFGMGIVQWKAVFFIRIFGLQTGELGTWFAMIYGVGGAIGAYCGGEWATRYAAANERLQLAMAANLYAIFGLISIGIYTATDVHVAFALLSLATLTFYTINGPLFALIQTLVPDRMRATSIALIYLFANLVGMGLGPLTAGILSDYFQIWVGKESIRYALLALCPGYFWAAWHLWRASRTVMLDLEKNMAGKRLPT